jgi:hypothetical protein
MDGGCEKIRSPWNKGSPLFIASMSIDLGLRYDDVGSLVVCSVA